MLNFHGIWACFLFDIKKLLRSSRFYMTILVVCFVIWDHLAPISTWLAAQHYKITPWVYPFISNSVFLQMVIVGGTLFLFSDAPFFDETQLLLIVRMNRVQWCMAQMIYICVSTMIYFAAIAFVSIFLFIPNITFSSRWGAVILALSRGETNLENVMSFSKYITESMSPIGANALCLLFSWMASVCLAEIQFFFNLDEKKQIGSIIAGFLILQDLFSLMILSENSEKYSIVALTRLSVLIRNGTIFGINSFEYSFFVLLFFMLLFFVLCLMRIYKTEIYIANRSQ